MTNVGELDRVLRHLQDHPRLHLQAVHACGSSGCIAGWTVALAHGLHAGDQIEHIIWEAGSNKQISATAQAILGLTDVEARRLFYGTLYANPIDECRAYMFRDGQGEREALALGWAILRRDKGCPEQADLAVLAEYGLPEEPQP